ncbi:MAG: T9SS type A sorting domain-containing protein [Ignavibacteria bacterium]|nr:T9SS type A sorting domain-containing protein [Ignavibacteria bacterium]
MPIPVDLSRPHRRVATLFALLLALAAPHSPTFAQRATGPGVSGPGAAISRSDASLFVPREAPRNLPGAAASRFFEIDPSVFDVFDPEPDVLFTLTGIPMPDGRSVTALVSRFAVVQGETPFLVDDAKPMAPPRHVLLRGEIEGEPGSRVYLAMFRGTCFGYVQRASGARVVFSPVGPRSTLCAVTAEADMPRTTAPPECHAEELPQYGEALRAMLPPSALPAPRKGRATIQSTATRLNLALDCDQNFYQLCGSSVSAATNYAIALLGGVSDIYRRDAGIVWYISYLNVWTTTGPYPGPNADSLLTQVRRYWLANHATVPRAVVQLLHGPGTGGIAWVDILCGNSYGYSMSGVDGVYSFPPSGYIWDIDVVSHELGHNVGSPHTHNCWWSPAVDSCVNAEGGSCYSTPNVVRGTIMSYCHLTSAGTELKFHSRVGPFLTSKANAASCKVSQSVPDVNAGPPKAVCSGIPVQIGNPATSGTPPYTYLWWPSAGLSSATVSQPMASPGVTIKYHVRATDANGFRAYDSVVVTPAPSPSAEAGPDQTFCQGNGATLGGTPAASGGTPPYSYSWTPATGLSATNVPNPVATPGSTIRYRVLVTDFAGCTARDSVLVQVGSRLTVDAGQDQTICNGTSTVIGSVASGGQPPYAYTWTPAAGLSDPNIASPVAAPSSSTLYTLTVVDAFGCTGNDAVLVTVVTHPNASLTWTGAVNNEWSTRGNWDQTCALPGTGSDITIPYGTQSPVNVPAISLGDLVISNGLTLALSNPMTVTGTLALQAGSIELGNSDLTIGYSGSISGGDAASFIVTTGNGALVQTALGTGGRTGTIAFPVGPAAATYAPVQLANTGTPDLFAVRVEPLARTRGSSGTPLASDAVNLTWHIGEAQLGGSNVTLGLQWNGADELPLFDRAHSFVARYNGSVWTPQGIAKPAAGTDPYTLSTSGVLYLGVFGVGDLQSPYPVDFLSFSASPMGDRVLLSWTTSSEINSSGFTVERRALERHEGTARGFVPSSRRAEGGRYRVEEGNPPSASIAYRLKQIDQDGAWRYSPEVQLDHSALPSSVALAVIPNPLTDGATIRLSLPAAGIVSLGVWDALGREVARVIDARHFDAGQHAVPFSRAGIPAGAYFLRVVTADETRTHKLLLR